MSFLSKKLKISKLQVVLLSIVLRFYAEGSKATIAEIAEHLSCLPIELLKRVDDFEALVKKGLITKDHEGRRRRSANDPTRALYTVSWTTFQGLFLGNIDKVKKIDKLTITEFVFAVAEIVDDLNNSELTEDEACLALSNLKEYNKKLPPVVASLKYRFTWQDDILVFILIYHSLSSDTFLTVDELLSTLDNNREVARKKLSILQKKDLLIKLGLLKFGSDVFIGGHVTVALSDKAKAEFLDNDTSQKLFQQNHTQELISPTEIRAKKLYYPILIQSQIDMIARALQPEAYLKIGQSLKAKGHITGFCILFHGEPGTGKTETVYQLARLTGRHIMMFDVTKIKDMYYGQSEKNIKNLFSKYHNLLKEMTPEPILLFNEADSIFSKRRNVTGNIISAENTIQNIILQEMEGFSGILIATTNMTQNFDTAFDRRFLYKIQFPRPEKDVRLAIWRTVFEGYSDKLYNYLSENFNLSGGQIDVVARKVILEETIMAKHLTEDEIIRICNEENPPKHYNPIGFKFPNHELFRQEDCKSS
jgi:hypothetical protein